MLPRSVVVALFDRHESRIMNIDPSLRSKTRVFLASDARKWVCFASREPLRFRLARPLARGSGAQRRQWHIFHLPRHACFVSRIRAGPGTNQFASRTKNLTPAEGFFHFLFFIFLLRAG